MAADTQLIDQNITTSTHLINSLDMDVPGVIQPFLNSLYSGDFGEFWALSFWGIPMANFFAALLVFGFFLLLRKFFTRIIISFLTFLASKSSTSIDDRIIDAMKEPIRFAFIVVGIHLFFLLIFKENDFIKLILESLIIITLFWALISIVESLKGILYQYSNVNDHLSKEMSAFIVRIIKITIFAIGLSTLLYTWGINVTALIASLSRLPVAWNRVLRKRTTVWNSSKNMCFLKVRSLSGLTQWWSR